MNRNPRQILTELLVLRAQGGSDRAFAELHDLWWGDVLRMAQVSVQDVDGAAEIAQDSWVAVARGLGDLRDPACFPRWLFQMVKRRGADWIRRRQRQRKALSHIAENQRQQQAARSDPSRLNETSPLSVAIEQLSVSDKELLVLYYEVGRSVPEIAEILEVPPGTVKSRLHAVRERLKTQIEKKTP